MRKIFLMSGFISLLLPSVLSALEMDILYKQFEIAGGYRCNSYHRSWSDSYDMTSGSALSETIYSSGKKHLGFACSSIDDFELQVVAAEWSKDGGAFAKAAGVWVFNPLYDYLSGEFTICGSINSSGQRVRIILKDLETEQRLIDETFTGPLPAKTYSYNLSVNPEHRYGLYISAKARTNDSLLSYVGVSASFMPEPATILLLGLGCLFFLRRSRAA